VSCKIISIEELDKIIPVNPPKVNKKIKPKTQRVGVLILILILKIVINQLNTFTPVGIAITMVAAEKYARVSKSIPTVNI